MGNIAIHAERLGKRYRLGRVESGYDQLLRVLRREKQQYMWALDDVSFDIEEGTSTAIIGRNGAGKSTLLKLLSRITEPTTGHADIAGRVGALLEVGTGFHAELTGRENVFFNGSLLGMQRQEVARKFDQIVEFSGVEKHIDTPVKWYSSGMYVRLGFAVAAFLEPEILIVDEVLAVGDAEFQKRCLGRMGEVAHDGRTVLFVSHNMQAVRRLCERGILLDKGELIAEGSAEGIARQYLQSLDSPDDGVRTWHDPADRPGDELCRFTAVRVTDENGEPAGTMFSSHPIAITFEFELAALHPSFTVAFELMTQDGVIVLNPHHRDVRDDLLPQFELGKNAFRCTIPPGLLNAGRYVINLRSSLHNIRWVAYEDSVLQFDVVVDHGETPFLNAQPRPCVVLPVLDWAAVEPVEEDELLQRVSGAASG
jgi:lipopolysaccharide transport system ATP-binding protein